MRMKRKIVTKKMHERLLSIVMIVVMILGLIPENAYATEVQSNLISELIYESGDFTITYKETNSWDTYVNVEITIKNNGENKVDPWRLSFDYSGTICNIWNADIETSESGNYTICAKAYNSSISKEQEVSFGFTASGQKKKPSEPKSICLLDNSKDDSEKTDNPNPDDDEVGYTIPEEWKGLNYALFTSGEEILSLYTNETDITGDVHSNQGFFYQGTKLTVGGTIESVNQIELQTASGFDNQKVTEKREQAEHIEMPDITKQLLTYCTENGIKYDATTNFTDESISIEQPIFVEGSVGIQSTSFIGSGILYARNSVTYNVGRAISSKDTHMFIAAEKGDITINGSDITLDAVLYAPNGYVNINANHITLNGRIIAKGICINGTFINIKAGNHDYDMLDFLLNREILPPTADFRLDSDYYLRDKNKEATVQIENMSYSQMQSDLKTVVYLIYHDKNNDGIFDESEIVDTVETKDANWIYKTTKVGKYQIMQQVYQEIPSDISVDEYTKEEIETLTKAEKCILFEVGNQNPKAGISMEKENSVDILYAYNDLTESEVDEYKKTGEAIKQSLENTGISVDSKYVKIAQKEANTIFDWKMYDHEEYEDTILPKLENHISIGKNDVKFAGYGRENYKDFTYCDLESNDYNELSFKITQTIGSGLEGTGILFGATVEEASETETAYNGHRYQLFEPGRTWSQAKEFCEKQGGYLASVTSDEECYYIINNVLKENPYNLYWLGGTKKDTGLGQQWNWLTGEDFRWTKWDSGEPNNVSESVLEMYGRMSCFGCWNDTLDNPGNGWRYGYDNVGTLCEWNGDTISGYVLLLTGEGMKLIQLDKVDIYNLQNGSYEQVESAGKLLGTFAYDITAKEHKVVMSFENGRVSITDNEQCIVDGFEVKEGINGNGIGALVSYTRHETNEEKKREKTQVTDINVSLTKGQTLLEAVKTNKWKDGTKHIVVCNAKDKIIETEQDIRTADIIAALYQDECDFIGLGSEDNKEAFCQIINCLGSGCMDFSEKGTDTLTNYAISQCSDRDLEIGSYITTDDVIKYKNTYKDAENDPEYQQIWEYDYVETFSKDIESEKKHRQEEKPITKFDKPGAYTIRLRVQDNPVGENDALKDYRLWSAEEDYEKLLLVQNRPSANVQCEVLSNDEDSKTCIVQMEYQAEDKDHLDDSKRGIRQEEYSYMCLGDSKWIEGRLPNTIDKNTIYLVKYVVTDMDGCKSKPAICIVNTNSYKLWDKTDDNEKPVITLKINKKKVISGTPVYIEGFAIDNCGIKQFEVYAGNLKILESSGRTAYVPYEEGTLKIRAKAVDLAGNEVEKTMEIEVYNRSEMENIDQTSPETCITSPVTGTELDFNIQICGTAMDETKFLKYTLSYREENEDIYTIFLESDKEVHEGVLGTLDISDFKAGNYEILLKAEDVEGNISCCGIVLSIETKQTEGYSLFTELKGADYNATKDKIDIWGTVNCEGHLSHYSLEYQLIGESEYHTLAEGETEITEGVLGSFVANEMESGTYNLLLTIMDINGNKGTASGILQYSKETNKIELETKEVDEDPNPPVQKNFALALSYRAADIGTEVQVQVTLPDNVREDTLQIKQGETLLAEGSKKATFTSDKAGTVIVTATGVTEDGENVIAQASCTFYNRTDQNPPNVAITSPTIDTVLSKPVDFVGSATDAEGLDFWKLEYRMAGEKDYILLNEGKSPVKDDILGHLDTTMLMNGQYNVRLTVQDLGGNIRRLENDYVVEGELKVGAMHLGFTDITAQMGGTTVSVNRVYDSRNKTSGDFGYGWSLGMQGMKLIESSSISDGYEMIKSGSIFSTAYQVNETKNHDVVVTYGDGTSDRFELTLTPDRQALVPISEVTVGYRCKTNQKVKLEIIGDTAGMLSSGEIVFYDESMYDTLSYKLTTEDGNVIYLNKDTGVYKIENTNGIVIKVDKDGYHAEDGKSITLTRDEAGRIIKAEDPAGNVIVYTYDDNGDLSSVTDAAKRTVTFTYDKKHNLATITDPMGIAVARNEYDDEGRLSATIDADGNRVAYTYDVEGRTELISDRLGNKTLYVYDDNGNVLSTTDANGNTTKSTYDAYGNVLSKTDAAGNVTGYAYDENGNLKEVTDAAGNYVKNTYNGSNLITSMKSMNDTEILIDYDKNGHLSATTDAEGNTTTYDKDKHGNVTGIADEIGSIMTAKYDKDGNVIESVDSAGNKTVNTFDEEGNRLTQTSYLETESGTEERTTKYIYNNVGELVQTIDPDGNSSSVERNGNGQMSAAVDSKGRRTEYSYDVFGNVSKIMYSDGTTESFVYDAEGRNTKTTNRMGLTTTYRYDKVGNLLEAVDARGNRTQYSYDKNYNVKTITAPTGAVTTYTYDALNRNTAIEDGAGNITSFTYDELSLLTATTDAKGNVTRYEYDANGNRTKVIYADGTNVETEYDARGRSVCQTDTCGRKTSYTYDDSDRLTEVKQNNGSITKYSYDSNGNLTKITDANGNVTTYGYDTEGRRIQTTLADGASSTNVYDKQGLLLSTTDYNGVKTTYKYDKEDRIQKTVTGTEETTYTYDTFGRITEIKTGTSTVSYTYNLYGELSDKKYENGQTVHYGYDTYGRNNEIKVSQSNKTETTTKYVYDNMDRLTRVVAHDGTATVYTYDANGNRETATFANGEVLTYAYDTLNRLLLQKEVDKNGTVIAQYQYTLGKGGERESVIETGACGTLETAYAYDKAGRLTKEVLETKDAKTTYLYEYDAVGNRISKTENGKKTTYTYNSRNQLETETSNAGTISYSYDANGNLLNQAGAGRAVTYTFDVYNHLTSYEEGGQTEHYTYDAEGVRRSKTNETETIYYVSDTTRGLSQTLVEFDQNDNRIATYTRGDTLISQTRGEQTSYYLYDGHGDVRALLNEAGRITDKYRYNAYGELLEQTGDTENHYLYTGEYYDGTSNLYYLRARYMNPSAGNFISMDTYEGSLYDPDTLHKYLYANANPVKYSDPSGNMFSAVGMMIGTTMNTIMNNFETLNAMGIISGLTNSAITALLGGSEADVGLAFFKGYIAGFGIGALMYVVAAYEVISIAQMCMVISAGDTVICVVLAIGSAIKGNQKEAIVYAALVTLSLFTFCQCYKLNCTVEVIGDKGSAEIGWKYDNPEEVTVEGGTTSDVTTGYGYDAGDSPVRIDGEWTINDMKQALLGHPPKGLGSPDIHHGGQMPGAAKHEIIPSEHRGNNVVHPNKYNQGVTVEMRASDRELHWWYRAREQGADELLPDWIYDD